MQWLVQKPNGSEYGCMELKRFSQIFLAAISAVLYSGLIGAKNAPSHSATATSTLQDPCAAMPTPEEQKDCKRNTAKSYPLGTVKRIHIAGSKYYDAENRICTSHGSRQLTKARVRSFLKNAIPISQISLMNYYGEHGECTSQNVLVVFNDGRSVNISFAARSNTAYVSLLANGQEADVYFYYCEKCSQ